MGQMEMECNSENSSEVNGAHLEGIFLFSLSLLLEVEVFDRCGIIFFYKWLKAVLEFCFTCFPSFFLSVLIIDFYFVTGKSRAIFFKNIMEKSIVILF